MNYTENYQLPQWEETDRVLREDFNTCNQKIETVLGDLTASGLRIASGTYIGTGAFGESNPNAIEFPFPPRIVVIQEEAATSSNSGAIFIRGQTVCSGISIDRELRLNLTWNDNQVLWYSTQLYPQYQLNIANQTYHYWAIG